MVDQSLEGNSTLIVGLLVVFQGGLSLGQVGHDVGMFAQVETNNLEESGNREIESV